MTPETAGFIRECIKDYFGRNVYKFNFMKGEDCLKYTYLLHDAVKHIENAEKQHIGTDFAQAITM